MSTSLYWKQQVKARRSRKIVWIAVCLLSTTLLWAYWAKLDEVIVGEGRVVPANAIQQIQSLEGGILSELHVRSGDHVEKGQLLATLDNTHSKAAWQEGEQQSKALQMLILRSEAELKSIKINSSEKNWRNKIHITKVDIEKNSLSKKRAQRLEENYNERLNQLRSLLRLKKQEIEEEIQAYNEVNSRTKTLVQSVGLSKKEIRLTKESVDKGAVASIELLKLKREQIRLLGELNSARLNKKKLKHAYEGAITDSVNLARDFRAKIRTRLTEARNQLALLDRTQPALEDRLERSALYSPLQGRIKDIARRTLGGVIKPGESIMEIVPESEKLVIETRIQPKDIAYLSVGLEAMVKFSAYDFVIYGGEKGLVTYISADALQDEEGGTYYKVNIETQKTQTNFDIIPGMQASVDIKTGKKSVLNYWLKPLLRARENALREP